MWCRGGLSQVLHHIQRRLANVAADRIGDEPVVALQGPRAVGSRRFDEFQHVPEILDAIKATLNRDLRPGRFVLTGSTRYDSLPRVAQSLTGRPHLLTVWPFSQGGARGKPRDVRGTTDGRSPQARLVATIAHASGGVASAAAAVNLKPNTAESHLKLLEAVFLLYRLPAWGTTLRRRAASSPKLHVLDSGMAVHMLGLTTDRLARLDAVSLSEFGHLLETFCVGEVRKQLSWQEERFGVGHWRTHDGQEVDLVVERGDGRVAVSR